MRKWTFPLMLLGFLALNLAPASAAVMCPADLDTLAKKISITTDATKKASAEKLHEKAASEMKAGKTKACAKTVTQGLNLLK
jgi:hypothetical protein